MTTNDVQADFEQRFQKAVNDRDAAIRELSDINSSTPRLKAKVAQARADVAKLRADAKAAGVKLPRIGKGAAAGNAASDASEENDD